MMTLPHSPPWRKEVFVSLLQMHPLTQAGILGASTCLLAAALTLLCIRLSPRLRLIANPSLDRWSQNATPNTGGVAIFFSCAAVYVVTEPGRYSVIAAGAAGIALLGFIDDRVQFRPLVKFCGQSFCVIAVVASGVVFRATQWELLNILISFFWIAGITNAFNLIDNMDGLCAGVTIIICGFRFWAALQTGDAAGAQISAIVAGGFLGFLLFNYKPAKIFMGDAGSMFAGFALSSLAIATPVPKARVIFSAVLYPLLTFLYPIFDTVLVSLLRRVAGKSISIGGRDHSSHRLASLGLGEQKVVWLLWILTGIGSAVGLLTYSMPIGVFAIAFLLTLATTMFGIFLGSLPGYEMPPTSLGHSSRVRRFIPTLRAGTTLVVDTLLAGISLLAAFLFRWEGDFSGKQLSDLLSLLPIVMVCQTVACLAMRTFNLGWRWLGLPDLLTLGGSLLLSVGALTVVLWIGGRQGYSLGIVVLYAFFLFSAMAGFRLLLGFFWQTLASFPGDRRRVAILGANRSTELLIRILDGDKELDAAPIVILDTDPAVDGTRIYGIPVRFAGSNQLKILREASVNLLVLPSKTDGITREEQTIIDICVKSAIPVMRLDWRLHSREFLGQGRLEKASSLLSFPTAAISAIPGSITPIASSPTMLSHKAQ